MPTTLHISDMVCDRCIRSVERVKDLLANGSLTTAEITFQLGYSSTQHLSSQFHTVTGQTLTEWRESPGERLKWDAKLVQLGDKDVRMPLQEGRILQP